uniref:C2H2-type domain-containing protein n=1 Tax=Ciona savignyi TaxID=51511 RepID=H2YAX0_CIOSA
MYQQPNIGNNVSPPRMALNGYTHGVRQQESFYSQQDVLSSPNYSIQHGAAYNPQHHQLNHTQPSVAHHHGHIPHQNLSMPSQMGVQQPHNYYAPQSHTIMQNTSYQQHNPPTFAMKNNNNNHSLPPTTPNYYVQPTAYHMQNNIYHPTQQYPTQTPISQPPAWETPPHNILHPQLSGTHLQSPKSDLSNSPVSNNGNDSKSSRANRSFTCPKCSKVFKRGDHLKRHLLSVHDREHPYQCGECSKGFAS